MILELCIDLTAKQRDAAGIGGGDVDDHTDRGRFARAVGPEQSKHSAGAHCKAELLNRRELSKTLGDPIELYRYLVSRH